MRVPFAQAGNGEADLGRPVRHLSLERDDLLLDVMKDGRLVVMRRQTVPPPSALNVITNWFAHVRRTRQP